MSLLNHIFRDKSEIKRELTFDAEKRIKLWEKHVENFPEREQLVKEFSPKNLDNTLNDETKLQDVLNKLENLISSEIVIVNEEEKTDKEILVDITKLRENHQIETLNSKFLNEAKKQETLIEIFKETHNTLVVELKIIRFVRKNTNSRKEILQKLFRLIFFNEAHLYKLFVGQFFSADKEKEANRIKEITKAILLEEKLEEAVESVTEEFARELFKKMSQVESDHKFRVLGEYIFDELVKIINEDLKEGEDTADNIRKLEDLIKNNGLLANIIKKKRKKYTKDQIEAVIIAFRKAYSFGHFENLEEDLIT